MTVEQLAQGGHWSEESVSHVVVMYISSNQNVECFEACRTS